MQRRALLSVVNIGVAVGALLVVFLYPRWAGYAIYAFLGWFVVSFALVWALRGPAPVPGPSPTPTGAASSGPAPTGRVTGVERPPPAPEVGFCIYCASDLRPDAARCPACGHPRAQFA